MSQLQPASSRWHSGSERKRSRLRFTGRASHSQQCPLAARSPSELLLLAVHAAGSLDSFRIPCRAIVGLIQFFQADREVVGGLGVVLFVVQSFAVAAFSGAVVLALEVEVRHFNILRRLVRVPGMKLGNIAVAGRGGLVYQ